MSSNLKEDWAWFAMSASWTKKTDHPGFDISIEILCRILSLSITDTRHWNDEKDRYWLPEDAVEKTDCCPPQWCCTHTCGKGLQ